LIDSDGYYDAQFNCYEIVQKNKLLAEQIKFLCDSLGFRTSLMPQMATINQRNYATEVYRVRFFGNLDTIPTKIKRKQARPLKAVADWRVTGITVEFDKEDDYYGFEIDGNHLFLLEDMTVTHNTAFTLSIARNAAVEFGKAIAFFSLEMSAVQLVNRLISAETGIAADKLKKGTLEDYEWTQLSEKVERLAEAKIFIDDTPAINIFELRAKCRRLKMQHDIQLIVVDYLQLMSGSTGEKTRASGNREQEISMISRSLKSIAKELNVPVIALSQLSRAVETRGGDKRPMLSDLRESGSIEQDADMVIFLYRPEYYGFDQDEEGNSSRGVAEVIIAKHRNGATDTAKVRFIAQNAKFTDLDNNFGGFGTDLNPIGDIITFGSRVNDFSSAPPSSGNSTPTPNNNDDIPF
jgi:replicative DNA helicase